MTLMPIPLDSEGILDDNINVNEGELRDPQLEDGGFVFDSTVQPEDQETFEFGDDTHHKLFSMGTWGNQVFPDDSDFGLFLNQVLDENPPWDSGNYARQMLTPYFVGWGYDVPEDFETNMGNHLWWDEQSFLAPEIGPLEIELDIEWMINDDASDTNGVLYPETTQGGF